MSKDGYVVVPNDVGELRFYPQQFPIETNAALVGWSLDFWRAFKERPKLFRIIARIAMGKYAYRELYGTYEALEKTGWGIDITGYELEGCDYHKDKLPWSET